MFVTDKVTMKWPFLITLFSFLTAHCAYGLDPFVFNSLTEEEKVWALSTETNDGEKVIKESAKLIGKKIKEDKKKLEYLFEERSRGVEGCNHCPRYFELTHSVNKVIEAMKNDPKYAEEAEIPVSLNRLRFLYYVVQSRLPDGSIQCNRYKDINPDLKQTEFQGQMEKMFEEVFVFPAINQAQLIDGNKEEITYYYRGEGSQKNIIIQATMTKDGGKFRYYKYHPTEKELNPYNLPTLGEDEPKEKNKSKKEDPAIFTSIAAPSTENLTPISKDKFEWNLDPKMETRMKIIPKDFHLGKASLSSGITGTGVRVNADTALSAKGSRTNVVLENEQGEHYLEVSINAKTSGDVVRKIAVPIDIRLGTEDSKDPFQLRGRVEDTNSNSVVSLSLTDKYTQYIRAELKRDRNTSAVSYVLAKDFMIKKDESATVLAGKNEADKKYAAFQHRKTIKGNVTMVLDARVDEDRKYSLYYQLHARW